VFLPVAVDAVDAVDVFLARLRREFFERLEAETLIVQARDCSKFSHHSRSGLGMHRIYRIHRNGSFLDVKVR